MLFAQRGVSPKHRFGQNFLIDLNIHDLITKTADLTPDDVVLEIGPGAGAMTALMASMCAAVVAVDIDPAMAALASEATAEFNDNLRQNLGLPPPDAVVPSHALAPGPMWTIRF